MVLPYLVSKGLPRLRLSPPGVKVERDQRPRWLGDYSYFKTNANTFPVACLSAMQYGWALDRLICKIVYTDPELGYVYLLKAERLRDSDGRSLCVGNRDAEILLPWRT